MADDFDRVQRNVQKMISMQAPTDDIDGYLKTEGMTPDAFKARIIERKGDVKPDQASWLEGFKASVNPAGLGDEVAAAGSAVGQYLGSKISDKAQFAGWGPEYDRALAERRALIEKFREENPVMGVVSSALGSGAIKAPVAGAAIPATLAGRAGLAAKEGAKMGALYGFTEGEGGAASRVSNMIPGAAIGAGAGAIGAPLIEGAIGGAQSLKGKLAEKFGGQDQAWQRKLGEALKRGEITPAEAQAQLSELGPNAMIADIPAATPLAMGVATRPGQAQQRAITALEERGAGRGERMLSSVGSDQKPVIQAVDDLYNQALAKSRPIYERSVNPGNVLDDAAFAPIKADEWISGQIKAVKGDKLAGMGQFDDASMPVLDQVKKNIDDMIEAAKRTGENNRIRLLTEKRDALVSTMDNAFPDYAAARAAYAAPMQVRDALEMGKGFLKESHQVIARDFAKMPVEQQEAFKIGAKEALSDLISNDFNAAANKFGNNKDVMWKKLRAVFPEPAEFDAFKRSMQAELKMQQTERLVNPRVGSQTAMRLEGAKDASNEPGKMLEGAKQIAGGDKLAGLMKVIGGARDWLNRPSAAVAEGLAPRMFSQDQAANQQTLGLLDSIAKDQAVSDLRKQFLARQAGRVGGVVGGDNRR